jgi:ketosteroid isomerase-like protein
MDQEAAARFVDGFFTAIEAGDLDAVRRAYDPGALIWHNTDGVEQDVEANLAVLGWLVKRLFDRHYEVSARAWDGHRVFQQHVLAGVTHRGEPFALPAAIVLHLAEDPWRVTRVEEYLDLAGTTPLS